MATAQISKITLGDFVNYLAAELQDRGVPPLFHDENPWHRAFYDMRETELLKGHLFEFDSRYPKSPELSEYLSGLAAVVGIPFIHNHELGNWLPLEFCERRRAELKELPKEERELVANGADLILKYARR